MTQANLLRLALGVVGAMGMGCLTQELRAEDAADTRQQIQLLQQQNVALQEQLKRQQVLIDSLSNQVSQIQEKKERLEPEPMKQSGEISRYPVLGNVRLGGEGGVGFFKSGSEGMFPNSEFRVDEARLFVDAAVVNDVYAYTEINLATREEPDVQVRLGEAYVDFENVSKLWNRERQLNLRLGRMYTPFGEEYQRRYAIDNPLISHSLSDLWAVDEGLEAYGRLGKFSYAVAVQNGGIPDTRDFDSDKSVAGRIGFDPNDWLHVSVSGMRTGNLDVGGDGMSAMWFASGFFRSLGSTNTTKFHVELVEGDVIAHVLNGDLRAFGGYIHYGDNDPTRDNQRDVYYYSVEGVHDIIGKVYGAARFSQIFAHGGFPIVGNGNFVNYFFGPLTEEIWRLSLGLGYRWNQNLVLKAEYSFEYGTEVGGGKRDHEDLFAMEAAFRF